MNGNEPHTTPNLNTGLFTWCQSRGIDASSLASQMGFSYMHAWRLLTGKSPVTAETIGRFVLSYGHEAAGELFSLSRKLIEDNEPQTEAHKIGGTNSQ